MLSTKESPWTTRYWLIDIVSILIFFGLFYALFIGSHALFTPDEGRYSEVAREMIVTGDYITPRLNGVAFLDKPVLYYWLQAAAIQLFGLKEWALRLFPALAGILGCVLTYLAGQRLFNRRTGILSAMILATCPLYYGAAHYANLDLEVAVLVSSALLLFITGIHATETKTRNRFLMSAYIFAGLAALTKGLIGIVFPAMIIGAWILLLNQWRLLKNMHLGLGLGIFLLITIPWYVLVQLANPEFFQFFFVKQQVARFLTTEHFNNRTPIWFYLPIVIAGIFPWCIFIVQTLFHHSRIIWQDRKKHSAELFFMLWLLLVFIFFSIPKSKTVGYILPIFPAIALLVGHYLSDCWEKTNHKGIVFGIIGFSLLSLGIVIVCLGLPHFPHANYNPLMTPYLTMTATIFAAAGFVLFFLRQRQLSFIFTALLITAIAFLLTLAASSSALNQKTIKPLAMQLKPTLQANDEVVTFYKYFQDLPLYLERRITIVADWQAPDIALNDNWLREMWYGMAFQDTKEWLIDEKRFWQRWYGEQRLFVFTNVSWYEKLQAMSKTPVYKIAEYNNVVVVSNRALNQTRV